MRKWKNRPMTWGDYVTLSGISLLISLPILIWSIVETTYLYGWEGLIDDIKDKFKK